jgi:TRAP-type C4-dicarboxylate transport system permease small subunit
MDERADLVLAVDRHLKWRALDGPERALMWLCGVCLVGFTSTTLLDVVARVAGHPLLWPQEVTSAFFIYGVFIGTSAATRRNDHLQLLALTEALSGTTRCVFEVVNRAVVMGVGLFFVVYGWQNFLTGFGSIRMPSMLPIAHLRADSAVWSIGGAVQSGTDRQRPAPRLRVPAPEWRLLSRCRTAPSL